jgi:signal transduction histidine kinase
MPRAPHSLVRRLVVAFLLPSVVILVAGAAIAYSRAASALRTSVFERLDAIATLKESAFDAWVEHLLQDVVFVSELPALVESASAVVAGGPAAEPPEAARARLAGLLELALRRTPSLTEVFFLAPSGGRILLSTDSGHQGQFRIADRYYVEGRRAPFVQNVYPSPVTLRPTLTISAPVRGQRGEVLGVLAAHLSLDYLDQNVLGQSGLGPTGSVSLVDRNKVRVTGRRYGDEGLSAAGSSQAIDEVILGQRGRGLYRDPRGTDVIGVYRWLEGRELGLIVEIHQQEALAPARRLVLSILIVGSSFLLLLVAGISLAAHRIARPILAIADAAASVSEGDLSARAVAATGDEIGVLARTFNQMVEQLAADAAARRRAGEEREALITELESKNAELERFTYTVSHDLKSPLLTIKGFLGYLERDAEHGDADRMRSDVRRISAAAEKMGRLLDELLELSRIGRVVNPPEPVALGAVAREVADAIARRDPGGGVEIAVAGDLPVIHGDPVRVREVLENLVENACRFMGGQDAPRVEIGRLDGDPHGFYVRDNGIGIAPPYHEKIFGLFERLEPSIEGTGVGLAIVRRIVEVHGGRVWVESAGEGKGSTFCVTLPGPGA